ncbi:hypothetical protein D3C75_1125150 [compost metagenome]
MQLNCGTLGELSLLRMQLYLKPDLRGVNHEYNDCNLSGGCGGSEETLDDSDRVESVHLYVHT